MTVLGSGLDWMSSKVCSMTRLMQLCRWLQRRVVPGEVWTSSFTAHYVSQVINCFLSLAGGRNKAGSK